MIGGGLGLIRTFGDGFRVAGDRTGPERAGLNGPYQICFVPGFHSAVTRQRIEALSSEVR